MGLAKSKFEFNQFKFPVGHADGSLSLTSNGNIYEHGKNIFKKKFVINKDGYLIMGVGLKVRESACLKRRWKAYFTCNGEKFGFFAFFLLASIKILR